MALFEQVAGATRGLAHKNGNPAPVTATGKPSALAMVDTQSDEACIEACRECQAACLELLAYSVRMQGYYSELGHVRLLQDCAKACETTVDFLLRGSEIRNGMLALCADLCRRCARDCQRFDYDQRLLDGAATCLRCAETASLALEI
jgi:hypothetical protein